MIYTLRCHVMKHEGHGCFTSFMICCTNLIKTYQPISVYNLFITNVTSIVLLCFIVLIRPVSSPSYFSDFLALSLLTVLLRLIYFIENIVTHIRIANKGQPDKSTPLMKF